MKEISVPKIPKTLLVLFSIVFITEFSLGYYISHIIGYVHSDSMSRVANAFYVIFSRDPHLAAIGFVWNPLPSLMEIPILLFYPLFPILASDAVAGVIMTSFFASLTAVLLVQTGLRFGLSKWLSLAISLCFVFNPFIFLFGANGLSDAPFIYFIIYATAELSFWIRTKNIGSLIKVSFFLTLAFWTRYEAVPFGAAIGIALFIAIWFTPHPLIQESTFMEKLKLRLAKTEGTLTLVLTPVIYSGLLWLMFNYTIMGNALYFLNSQYSNVAQSQGLTTEKTFINMIGNPFQTAIFVAHKLIYFSIPLLGILVLRIWNRRFVFWDFSILFILYSSIFGLQFLLLMKGTSYGWLRYFLYVYPITVAWLPYELSKVKATFMNAAIVLVSLILTIGILTNALFNPIVAPDENKFLHAKQYAAVQKTDKEVAAFLESSLKDATILMDSYSAYAVILNSDRPSRYIITSDVIFNDALASPSKFKVDYILSPKPDKSSALSADNLLYPNFYEKGASFVTLYKEFGGRWRLYKVIQ